MKRQTLSFLIRLCVTAVAFWLIIQKVDLNSIRATLLAADRLWLLVSITLFFLAQVGCVIRWHFLVPAHPSLTWPFLTGSFFVASFFNTFLPTTVGGDLIRGYDLIKATGEWRGSLASVLVDRLLGLVGFLLFALGAWIAYPPARQDAAVRAGFGGFLLLVIVTFAVLGSRRVLQAMLRPFSKIGLGQLQSHAKQFQEALRGYLNRPKKLLCAFGTTLLIQTLAILMFAAVTKALHLPSPLLFLMLVVPIILTISQLPVSLNGWGIREWAAIHFLGRIGIGQAGAVSVSLIYGAIPILAGIIGGLLFLARRRRK